MTFKCSANFHSTVIKYSDDSSLWHVKQSESVEMLLITLRWETFRFIGNRGLVRDGGGGMSPHYHFVTWYKWSHGILGGYDCTVCERIQADVSSPWGRREEQIFTNKLWTNFESILLLFSLKLTTSKPHRRMLEEDGLWISLSVWTIILGTKFWSLWAKENFGWFFII